MISLISPENIEYKSSEHEIKWRENIKTKTHFVHSYIIDDSLIVTSKWKLKFLCKICGKETIIIYSNWKNKKSSICICCQRKLNLKGKKFTEERKNNISIYTKIAMSKFSEEKKLEIQRKKVENIDWEKRNSNWMKTMQSKSLEEKLEINKKRRNTFLNKSKSQKMEIQANRSKNNMIKYGVEHVSQVEEIQIKQQQNIKKSWKTKYYNSIFGIIHYQTKPELEFIKFCESRNIFVKNGPRLVYRMNNKTKYYFVDFETEKYLVEIKASHVWYYKDLESGKLQLKNNSAEIYCNKNNKRFLFLLDPSEHEFNIVTK